MDLQRLRYFVAVAEELHFSRAAQRLGVSQPTLSAAIRALELEHGVVLFERTSRRVALTVVGATLLPQARAALAQVDQLVRTLDGVDDTSTPSRRRLVVGSILTDVAAELIVPLLSTFKRGRPHVDLELVPVPNSAQFEAVRTGQVDVLFSVGPYPGPEHVDTLFLERRVVVTHRRSELSDARVLRLRDLEDVPMLRNEALPAGWMDFWLLGDVRPLDEVPIQACGAENLVDVLAHAMGGTAVTTLPERCRRLGDSTDLALVPIVGVPMCATTLISRRPDDPVVHAFRTHALQAASTLIDLIPGALRNRSSSPHPHR